MDRWQNKIAVVTGASSGIGARCAIDLVKAGLIVVGLARRNNRIADLRCSLPIELHSKLHAIKCDLTKENEILSAFKWIEKHLGGIDVLINNAGIVRYSQLISENNTSDLIDILNTNVLSVAICTREAFLSMKKRNFDGYVFVINSLGGHKIPSNSGKFSGSCYYPSKHALVGMVEIYRQEFLFSKTKIKITNISPGVVDTPAFEKWKTVIDVPFLQPEDISSAILYCLQTAPHVQIQEMIIKPIGSKL